MARTIGFIVLALGFAFAGFWLGWAILPPLASYSPNGAISVGGKPQIITNTVIRYVEKLVYPSGTREATDLEAVFSRPEFHVIINGHPATITPAAGETFIFEKNKLELQQTSSVSFEVKISPVDLTQHYGLGVGIGFNGISGMGSFPAQGPMDGWVYADRSIGAAGVMIRF